MYEWSDLICNPGDDRIQKLIGQEVFASISPMLTLEVAERGKYVQKLVKVNWDFPKAPFTCEYSYMGIKRLENFPCIISKNKESLKY